ncbi:hypothetical protein DRF65_26995, partial [Chryseobacterium pennae]
MTLNKNKYATLMDSTAETLNINNPRLLETKKAQGLVEPYSSRFDVDMTEKLDNGSMQTIMGTIGLGYNQRTLLSKGWFDMYKEYYPNGNIKSKRIYNKTSPGDYGLMYEFDEQGKLAKTIDFDEGWKTSFEAITEIAKKYIQKYNYKIDVSANAVINADQQWNKEYIKIWRKESDGKKYWQIGLNKAHYDNPDDKKCERVVILV